LDVEVYSEPTTLHLEEELTIDTENDDEGHAFAMTYEESENPGEYMFDVFNRSGIFVSRISMGKMLNTFSPLGITRRIAAAKNGCLYCLKEKESGYMKLVVYRMLWG
jgi:hypothetical protein